MFWFEDSCGVPYFFLFLGCVCGKYLKIHFFQNGTGWFSVELDIKKSSYSPLVGVLWRISAEAVVSVVMSTLQEGWKILWAESSEVLLANDMFPCATRIRYAFEDWLRERSFCIGLVPWNTILLITSKTSFLQHLERGHFVIPCFPVSLPFPMIFQDLQLHQLPALCLNKVTTFYPLTELFLEGSCRKRIHIYKVTYFWQEKGKNTWEKSSALRSRG